MTFLVVHPYNLKRIGRLEAQDYDQGYQILCRLAISGEYPGGSVLVEEDRIPSWVDSKWSHLEFGG